MAGAVVIVDVIEIAEGVERTREHDWTGNLPSPAAIFGNPTVTAVNVDTGADATSAVVAGTATASGVTTFKVLGPAGAAGKTYRVTLHMARTDDEVFENYYLVRVLGI